MGKPTGFMEQSRQTPPKRGVAERVGDFREIYLPQPEEALRAQASRCMDCGVPFCHEGCPLGNLIPDFNDLVYRGRFEEAAKKLAQTNNFPDFTGRLCPAPCEASCVLSINDAPVTIKEVEKALAEHQYVDGRLIPEPPAAATGKRVAIVGSGPAGLACAQQLAREGHEVVVFERADRPGGLLRYGIPDFKMEKSVLDTRLDQLRSEGVQFACNVELGGDEQSLQRLAGFDAICLATGALNPRGLGAVGEDLGGVVLALEYLEQENRNQAGDTLDASKRISAQGKQVIVIGGGDTGADCLGTAHRQGALRVVQLEILDRPPEKRVASDPWPTWPNIFRVSPAHEEGGEREFSLRTLRLEGEGGHVRRLVAERVTWGSDGPESSGEELSFEAELVLIATGYTGPEPSPLYRALGVALDERGRVAADERGRTDQPNVFSCGDARRGASLVVWAIAEGRRTAESISASLAGRRMLKVS